MAIDIRKRSRLAKAELVLVNNGVEDIEFWDVKLGVTVIPADDDVLLTVASTDRLDAIADEHLGDARLWDVIGDLNGLMIPPLDVNVGDVLRIPSRQRLESDIRTGEG